MSEDRLEVINTLKDIPSLRREIDRLRSELATAAKVVRNCHDERNAAVAELAAKDARIAELEKERDADLWFDQLKMECAKTVRLRTLLIDKERDNDALRRQLAEFGAGEDTTTMTRKSFAEVLQALADVKKEFEAYKVNYEYNDADLDMAVECEVKERDAARKELVEAKAVLARVGVCMSCWNGLSMYEQGCTDCLNTGWRDGQPPAEAALEDAKSRIAELEERNRDCRDAATRISGEITARAARAEAELAQVKEDLHYANGTADLAREALQNIVHGYF